MLFDIIYILLFFGIVALGFFRGAIQLTILLVSFYISLLVASFTFELLANFFIVQLGTGPQVAIFVSFSLLVLIGFTLFSFVGIYNFREVSIPDRFFFLDHGIGMFLGIILGALFLGMFADLLWTLMIERGGETLDLPIARLLGGSMRNSFLLQYFQLYVLPRAYDFANPFLPDSVEILFRATQQ
jgi:membrane protein required for colicin V production